MSIFVDPQKAVEALDIYPGVKVADVGCGVGHYVFAVAEKMENKGRIYAIDIRKNVLDKVASEAKEKGLTGLVEVIWGDAEAQGGTKLADGAVDAAVASNIFFQVDNKEDLARELSRIIKENGELLVVDWSNSFGGLGPPPDYIVSPEEIKEICQDFSLNFQVEYKTGSHHYELLFKKIV